MKKKLSIISFIVTIVTVLVVAIRKNSALALAKLNFELKQKVTKRTEKLATSEGVYRELFENMLHGFSYCKVLFDNGKVNDYIYLEVNKAYESLTGLKEVRGKKISEVMPGLLESDPVYSEMVGRVALSGKPETFETYAEPLKRWFSISLYCPEKGYFVCLVDNITERKQAAEEIEYRANLLKYINDAVIATDDQLRITSWNKAAEVMYGWRENEVLGQNSTGILKSELTAEERAVILLEVKKHGSYRLELVQYRRDGQPLNVEANTIPLYNEHKQFKGFLSVNRDVTLRKEATEKLQVSESRLKEAQAIAHIGNWEVDLINKTQTWSDEMYAIYGIKKEELQASMDTFLSFMHRDDFDFAARKVEQALASGTNASFTYRFIRKDGALRYCYTEWKVEVDQTGKPMRLFGITQDTTEKKEGEEILAASEQRFRALVENDFSITSLMNEKFETIYRSPSSEHITGWTSEERKTIAPNELTHPDDKEYLRMIMKEVLAKPGKPIRLTIRTKHKNGNYIWLDGITVNRLTDPIVRGIITNLRDITERKEAEEKLLHERTLLRTLIDNLPDYIYVKDTASRHLINNKAMVRLIGASNEEETLGKSSTAYFGPGIAKPYLEQDQIIFKSGVSVIDLEETTITETGEIKHLLTTKIPLKDIDNQIVGLVGISHDITLQKQIELDLRESKYFLERAQEVGNIGSWVYDLEKGTISLAKETIRIFGLSKNETVIKAETMVGLIHPDDREKAQTAARQTIEGGQPYRLDHRIVLNDGVVKWMHIRGNVTRDDKGRALLFVGVSQDITERKNAEAEILKLNAELEDRVAQRTVQMQAANNELEAFTYSVSHDLRAPLRIIDGFAKMLVEDYSDRLDEEGKRTLNVIMNNANKMGQLIDDLLDFSRVGRTEIRVSEVNMDNLVKEVLDELAISGVSIPDHIRVDNLRVARGDFNLLKQVWMNLLSNAIKYSSKKEGPRIEIGMKEDAQKNVYFIKDNGAGFSMKYYSKLFGVFQRLHQQQEFSGTGVGLALVQRIIFRHGGTIWAEAAPGEGATFYFSLPDTVNL